MTTATARRETILVFLFDGFETLDVFGPVEVLGGPRDQWMIRFYSVHGGTVRSVHDVPVQTEPLSDVDYDPVALLVPGGIDMALAFVRDRLGENWAEGIATGMEYTWNSDPDNDPFAVG